MAKPNGVANRPPVLDNNETMRRRMRPVVVGGLAVGTVIIIFGLVLIAYFPWVMTTCVAGGPPIKGQNASSVCQSSPALNVAGVILICFGAVGVGGALFSSRGRSPPGA